MKRSAALILTMVAMISLAGCSMAPEAASGNSAESMVFGTTEEAHAFAIANDYELMAKVLEDSAVTREEYEAAFNAKTRCFEEIGWTTGTAPAWNPLDRRTLISDSRPPAAAPTVAQSDASARCQEQFEHISYLFQTTVAAETDAQLLAFIETCLNEAEVAFEPGQPSFEAMVGAEASNGPDFDVILNCATQGMNALYPDLAGYSIAF